jgi:hypothetical protein
MKHTFKPYENPRLIPPDVAPAPQLNPGDLPLPGRTVVRNQGCWNCTYWNNEQLYNSHRLTRRMADIKALLEQGLPLEVAEKKLRAGDHYMQVFSYGICLSGGGEADFVPARFKCAKWKSLGGAGTDAPQDPLVDELKDMIGDPT